MLIWRLNKRIKNGGKAPYGFRPTLPPKLVRCSPAQTGLLSKSRSNSSGVKENGMAIEANQPEFSGRRLILEQAKLWAL